MLKSRLKRGYYKKFLVPSEFPFVNALGAKQRSQPCQAGIPWGKAISVITSIWFGLQVTPEKPGLASPWLWHDRLHSFLFVWVSVRESLCLFCRETHTKGMRMRPEVEGGRKATEKIERISRQKRTEDNSQLKGAEETGRQNRAVTRWVSIPRGFVEVSRKIHARDSQQMHGEQHKSVTNSLLLCLELTQVRVCSFFLFSSTLSVMFCVSVQKCIMPLVGNR